MVCWTGCRLLSLVPLGRLAEVLRANLGLVADRLADVLLCCERSQDRLAYLLLCCEQNQCLLRIAWQACCYVLGEQHQYRWRIEYCLLPNNAGCRTIWRLLSLKLLSRLAAM